MKTGIIYIIKNDVNEKVYIGQTTSSIGTRFHQHLKKSTVSTRHYKIYNAIKKYGREHFRVELIEENIPVNMLDEKEIYYIEKYDSFNNGYNSSKGGDGRIINKEYDEEEIVKEYNKGKSMYEISKKYEVSYATISRVLNRLNIETRHDGNKYEGIDDNKFVEMWYQKDILIDDLAKEFKVDPKTIRRHSKRLKLGRKGFRLDMNKKELHIFLWKRENDSHYVTDEYVYENIPESEEIKKLINDRKIFILIGENPSKATGISCDETNMYLKNILFEKGYDGYILLNIFSQMATNFFPRKSSFDEEYLKKQTTLLKSLRNCEVCVFYGKNVINIIKEYKYNEKQRNIIKEYFDEITQHSLYYTNFNGEFIHPAKPSAKGKVAIDKFDNSRISEIIFIQ